jgi:predicted transcriptional regulator
VEEVKDLIKALEELDSMTSGIADEQTWHEIQVENLVKDILDAARKLANVEQEIAEFLLAHARKTIALSLDEVQIPEHAQAALLMYAGSYLECAGKEIQSGTWRTK